MITIGREELKKELPELIEFIQANHVMESDIQYETERVKAMSAKKPNEQTGLNFN